LAAWDRTTQFIPIGFLQTFTGIISPSPIHQVSSNFDRA
jgi:hypothetical protein